MEPHSPRPGGPTPGDMVTHYLLDLAASVAWCWHHRLAHPGIGQRDVFARCSGHAERGLRRDQPLHAAQPGFSYLRDRPPDGPGRCGRRHDTAVPGSAVRQAFAMIGELVLNLIAAMPSTLPSCIRRPVGRRLDRAGRVRHAGGTVIAALLHARTSPWRLPLVDGAVFRWQSRWCSWRCRVSWC